MKILTNEKYYRLLVIICFAAYVCSFLGTFYNINNELKAYEYLYASLMESSKNFNDNLHNENQNNLSDNVEVDEPLFVDAITAVNYAYNLTMNNPYEIKVDGKVIANAMGMTVNVKMQSTQIYYPSGAVMIETTCFETDSNFGQTKSTYSYFKNNDRWQKTTTNVSMDKNGNLSASYKNDFVLTKDYGAPKNIIVNLDTIAKEVYFKVNRNVYTNKIESYSASVILKPTQATLGYDKQVMDEGGLDGLPIYKNLELNCVIDANGNLKTMHTNQRYISQMNLFGGISIDCNQIVTYYITSTKTPSVAEPIL